MTSFSSERFKRYVKHDCLEKVKKICIRYGLSIIEVSLDRKKRSAVHLACKYGSSYCLQYFLRQKLDLIKGDRDGNLPLHYILKKKKVTDKEYIDLLKPMLLKCSSNILDIPNNKGVTPRNLLDRSAFIHFMKENSARETNDNISFEDSSSSTDSWYEKLHFYASEDYEENLGKFEHDHNEEYAKKETYDEWAERLFKEYSQRHHHHTLPSKKEKLKSGFKNNKEQPKLKDDDKSSKPLKSNTNLYQKMRFIAQTKLIFDQENKKSICLKDLPWIKYKLKEEKLLEILICEVNESDAASKKKFLKKYLLQWHPDKFSQMCNHRLDETEKGEIEIAVNNFSQLINSALQKLN